MINSNWGYRIRRILGAWDIENPVLPVAGLGFPVSESVHSKPLPFTLVPGSFVPMPISESINSKPVHFVSKILPSICVPVPENGIQLFGWRARNFPLRIRKRWRKTNWNSNFFFQRLIKINCLQLISNFESNGP